MRDLNLQPGHPNDPGQPRTDAYVCRLPERPDGAQEQDSVQTDEQLMATFIRGSADAFNLLFLRYRQPLFGFFRRRLASTAQAEDLAQETFVAVLRAQHRYQASALFRTYLYAVAYRVLQAYRRKTAFRAAFFVFRDLGPEPAASPALDTALWMRQAIAQLGEVDREILLLREFEQLTYAEIATLLKLPVNTVRSRLFRARMALGHVLTTPHPQPATTTRPTLEERA